MARRPPPPPRSDPIILRRLKLLPVVLAALAPTIAPAQTADWRVVSNGSDGSQLATNATSLRCEGDLCSALERTTHLQPLADGASVVRDQVQYDCAHALTRTLEEADLAADGRKLRAVQGPSPWSAVQLDTIGFASMRFACSARLGAPSPPRAASVNPPAATESPPSPKPHRSIAATTRTGAMAVQVTAGATDARVRSTLGEIARADPLAHGLSPQVQSATVRGRPVYRGLFVGFASVDQAVAFCRRLQRAGHDCMVRKSTPRSALAGGATISGR